MSACLMLHGIGPVPPHIENGERPYWVPQKTFATLLGKAKTHDARLTIDDGNDSDTRTALPMLVDAGVKATFFIPTGRIGTPGYVWEEDIRTLHAAGMEIGSHGSSHLDWTTCSDAEIATDVTASVSRLAEIIQAPVRSVAIPFGHCDRRVLAVLRRIGIARAYSSFRGPDDNASWLVRRDCIMAETSPAEIDEILTRKPSPAAAALTFLRIWHRTGNAVLWAA